MAFNINPGKQQFSATAAQTVFTFNFAIFTDTDLKVYKTLAGAVANDTADLLTISTHYTVSINGTLGGTVTLLSGASLNDTITIVRVLPVTRTTDYVTNGDLYADTLDLDQDYQTYLVQDGYVQLGRSIIVPESLSGVSLSVPAPVANAYFRWNSTANALENDISIPQAVTDATTQAGIATAQAVIATTQAGLSSTSATNSQLRAWEAEAEKLTADSYATEAENIVVKTYASNGNGTFIATNTAEYSALHWAAKALINANFAPSINAATVKPTPIDTDKFGIWDSVSGLLNSVSWANIKTNLGILVQDFRITLSSGVPVTISDITAATILYLTPYKGNKISLYNGVSWDTLASPQISIAIPATSSQMYDIFIYNNNGAASIELTAWTNDTTRAAALVYQDGILVKSGTLTRRYVGSFRTTPVSGQTEDSGTSRYVWNYYNRIVRNMDRREPTVSWTYTTSTWRQANANTANQLNFIIGVSEDAVSAMVTESSQSTGTGVTLLNAIGLDSTIAIASGCIFSQFTSALANTYVTNSTQFKALVSAGAHYLTWLEQSTAAGTTTWVGNNNFGIKGELLG